MVNITEALKASVYHKSQMILPEIPYTITSTQFIRNDGYIVPYKNIFSLYFFKKLQT